MLFFRSSSHGELDHLYPDAEKPATRAVGSMDATIALGR